MNKYKIGETYKDIEFTDLIYKIIYVSPKTNSDNEYTYFVEIISKDDNNIFYGSFEENFFNKQCYRKDY